MDFFAFDGERFTRWTPEKGEALPSNSTWYLFGARDGSLYVSTDRGLARIANGHVKTYPMSPRWPGPFVEDKNDVVWMGISGIHSDPSSICKVGADSIQCFGPSDGSPCTWGFSNAIDSAENIWIDSYGSVCRWKPGSTPRRYRISSVRNGKDLPSIRSMAIDSHGGLWVGTRLKGEGAGLLHFANGGWSTYVTPQVNGAVLSVSTLLADHNGSLWIGTPNRGIYRIAGDELDHYDVLDGLTDHDVLSIFEDREGGVWVATPLGIDYFRDYAVLSVTSQEGSSADHTNAVAADEQGNIYLGSSTLGRIHGSEFTQIYDERRRPLENIQFLFSDSRDNIWIDADNRLLILSPGQKVFAIRGYSSLAGAYISYIAEDSNRDIWVAVENLPSRTSSLICIRQSKVIGRFHATAAFGKQVINAIAANSSGGLWVGGSANGLFLSRMAALKEYPARGWSAGWRTCCQGRMEACGSSPSMVLFDTRKDARKPWTKAMACPATMANIQDDGHGATWFYMHCGIMRVSNGELAKWWKQPTRSVNGMFFDALRGARPNLSNGRPARTPDGQLWSATDYVFQLIDTNHLPFNSLPPPVALERLIVDGQELAPDHELKLAKRSRQIEVDYAALSYLIPEAVQFRYRLEGYDSKWTDAGNRRKAFFSDLRLDAISSKSSPVTTMVYGTVRVQR